MTAKPTVDEVRSPAERLAVAHEREAAWIELQGRTFHLRADEHRRAAKAIRAQMHDEEVAS